MCEAATIMAGIGLGVSAAGSIYNAYQEGQAGDASVEQARRNAVLANEAARDAEARGAVEAGQVRQQATQVVGAQRAALAAAGVDVSSGIATDLAETSRRAAELDVETIKNNAAREARGFRQHGLQYLQQAQLERTATRRQTTSTLIGGIGQAAQQGTAFYYQGQRAGLWGS